MAKQLKVEVKKYSMTKEQRAEIEELMATKRFLQLMHTGIENSTTLALMKARERLLIGKAPDGFTRSVDFDPREFKLVVTDTPNEPEKKEKA